MPALALVLLLTMTQVCAQLVPAPQHLQAGSGVCTGRVLRCAVPAFEPQVDALLQALQRLGAKGLRRSGSAGGAEVLVFDQVELDQAEAYQIETRENRLWIRASSPLGIARATASLVQLARIRDGAVSWPELEVRDRPDQVFRCLMVDMGRNPQPPALLRQVVDACWFYKLSYLHLHLSDDQLFSWPSTAFPKLQSPRAGWTLADFVALEAYSQARGVTLIPEVDVPGHSTILRRCYPEVFGKTSTELARQASAQRGMETLIDELCAVFRASPYIHIGGDEAYGVPADLQRDFINRLNRYIKSKGRRTLVWEGPSLGEGANKVAEDVLHINWRTVDFPAQQMLDAGCQVVNAAWDPLYIVDHYPRTMFTAVDLQRCYAFDRRRFAHVNHQMPTFARPHVAGTDQGILGFCMPYWEGRAANLLGLCVPRLAAVGAAAWNRAGESDYPGFLQRQLRALPRLEQLAGFTLPRLPRADPALHRTNLAFGAKVQVSSAAEQPPYGPERLTNGLLDRFDHFLGYPTQPRPLEIVIDLGAPQSVQRVLVHETAVGGSYEVYTLLVSADGVDYQEVSKAGKGSRGRKSYVEHRFAARRIRYIKIATSGCHGLTFPSFSRLCEVLAFAD